jgi:glycogen(starch) synthase
MKIALVGDRPPPSGGIAVHVETLARALTAAGHEVAVLDTARVRQVGPFAAALCSLVARGHLLHVHTSGHNPKSWALAAAGGLARGLQRRNVITLHSGLLPGYLEGMPLRQQFARQALASYGRIVGVSAAVTGALRGLGISQDKLTELPAFSGASLQVGPLLQRARTARNQHPVLLTAALAPSPIYGAALLFSALRQLRRTLPDAGLLVFGPGTDRIGEQVAGLGLSDCVHGLGECAHGEVLAAIKQSDLFVRPTLTDGDALSVREALALGVRTLASDVVARPFGVRTFRSGDPFALATGIQQALEAPTPSVKSVDAVPELISIYQALLGGRRAA